MKSFFAVAALLTICCLPLPRAARSQDAPQFLYTNNNLEPGENSVSGYMVSGATLTALPGSPFSTGGGGTGQGLYGVPEAAAVEAAPARWCLYVSNSLSGNVAAFQLDSQSGVPTSVTGSPFATGGSGAPGGIGLAPTPDGKYLFSSQTTSKNLSVFAVQPDCSLQLGQTYATADVPYGIEVTNDGRFLVMGYGTTLADTFTIGPGGTLAENGPFTTAGNVAGVGISCDSRIAIFGDSAQETKVEAFQISSAGGLSSVPGSPFKFNSGNNSNIVMLDRRRNFLFVTNQGSSSVTSLAVHSTQPYLTLVQGSPFHYPILGITTGMALSRNGETLFAATLAPTPAVASFNIGKDGSLTNAPGSPVLTNEQAGLISIVTVPPHGCS